MSSSRYGRDDGYQYNYGNRRQDRRQSEQYYDARPDRRRDDARGGRVQDVSYSEIQRVRRGERASMDQPLRDQDIAVIGRRRTQEESDAGSRDSRRTSRRDRYADDRGNDYGSDYSRSRRRKSAPGYDYGGGERSGRRAGRSDRDRDGSQANDQQVAQYQQQRGQQQQQQRDQNQSKQNDSQENTQEKEPDPGFLGRRFDHTPDGMITAVAGAALGAITARHFFGPKEFSKEESTQRGKTSKHWKMIGGAVLGAAAFNAGQQKFTTYFEEDHGEDAEMGLETAGELIGAMAPDVM